MSTTGALLPIWRWQILDGDGAPVAGAKLYTYLSGTSTPHPVYSSVTIDPLYERTNPVVADADGVFPVIFLDAVAYRMKVTDSTGVTIYADQDDIENLANVSAGSTATDVSGTAGSALSARDSVYLSDGSGALTAGRWYKTDGDATYSATAPMTGFVVSDVAGAGDDVTVRIAGVMTGFSGLAAGSLYYASGTAGAITASAPTYPRIVAQGVSTTSVLIGANPPNAGAWYGLLTLPTGQIAFPAAANPSADANTLDDYEVGIWTPVIGGASATSGQSYSSQTGRYEKIGDWVMCSAFVQLSAKGTITGNVEVQGLPLTVGKFSCVSIAGNNLGTSWVTLNIGAAEGGTVLNVQGATAAATGFVTSLVTADIANTTSLSLMIAYLAA